MVDLVKFTEAEPASYPAAPASLSAAAAALDPDFIWHRLEVWCSARWIARDAEWIIEGPGEWVPHLSPTTISTVEVWRDGAWEAVTLDASPLGGYVLPAQGPYRFSGQVGGGAVPAAVSEAFRRFAEYAAEDVGSAGVSDFEEQVPGVYSVSLSRSPNWLAKAM